MPTIQSPRPAGRTLGSSPNSSIDTQIICVWARPPAHTPPVTEDGAIGVGEGGCGGGMHRQMHIRDTREEHPRSETLGVWRHLDNRRGQVKPGSKSSSNLCNLDAGPKDPMYPTSLQHQRPQISEITQVVVRDQHDARLGSELHDIYPLIVPCRYQRWFRTTTTHPGPRPVEPHLQPAPKPHRHRRTTNHQSNQRACTTRLERIATMLLPSTVISRFGPSPGSGPSRSSTWSSRWVSDHLFDLRLDWRSLVGSIGWAPDSIMASVSRWPERNT